MARRKKKGTPAWVDKLLNFREPIGEEEYTRLWRRINRASRNGKDEEAWNAEGQRIIRELETAQQPAIFHSRNYANVTEAQRAAQVYAADNGGRIIRRDSRGRFSKRGRTFQVIGSKK